MERRWPMMAAWSTALFLTACPDGPVVEDYWGTADRVAPDAVAEVGAPLEEAARPDHRRTLLSDPRPGLGGLGTRHLGTRPEGERLELPGVGEMGEGPVPRRPIHGDYKPSADVGLLIVPTERDDTVAAFCRNRRGLVLSDVHLPLDRSYRLPLDISHREPELEEALRSLLPDLEACLTQPPPLGSELQIRWAVPRCDVPVKGFAGENGACLLRGLRGGRPEWVDEAAVRLVWCGAPERP